MKSSGKNEMVLSHIIRALLLVLSTTLLLGCSVARLGYGQLPSLSYWWVDSYLDLNDPQSVTLRADLQALLSWHRQHELPELARTLADLQAQALRDTTPAQVCQIVDRLQPRLDALLAESEPALTRLALNLGPQQLQHLQHQLDKRAQKWRDEWLADNPEQQQQRRLERLTERSEGFYGPLSEAQIAVLRAGVQATVFDTRLAEADLLRRHRDWAATLQTLAGSNQAPAQAQEAVHALLTRTVQSPDAVYREQLTQLIEGNCRTFAQLHNSATQVQRQKLIVKLKSYEDDARALMMH